MLIQYTGHAFTGTLIIMIIIFEIDSIFSIRRLALAKHYLQMSRGANLQCPSVSTVIAMYVVNTAFVFVLTWCVPLCLRDPLLYEMSSINNSEEDGHQPVVSLIECNNQRMLSQDSFN